MIAKTILRNFWKSDQGTTSIEYAVIAGLVAVAIVLAVTNLGGALLGLFSKVAQSYPK